MAKTFMDLTEEAQSTVDSIEPEELKAKMDRGENVLVIDVRDAADIVEGGIIPGAVAVSMAALTYKADPTLPEEMQHEELGDFDREIVTSCFIGAISAMSANILKDMGYTNVKYISGGSKGWEDAGLELAKFKG